MSKVGDPSNPLRVAIVGAGPTGFYATDQLFKHPELTVTVDMFDRLPTPFGLVRCGVAPDHQKIKNVTRVFDKVALNPGFRFFGNVEIGRDVTIDELRRYYHQIFYATGAQADRNLGIPGEDLIGSHSATEFVAWYNGHPDYRHCTFDLSQERVAVVGVGNVAVDVARILSRTPEELETTDIADYALEALRHSRVREIYMLGRRGPAQAAFTVPEVKELGELEDADVMALPEEAEPDPLTNALLERTPDKRTLQKLEILRDYAHRTPAGKSRRLILRFLVSPVALEGDADGRITRMRIVKNELVASGDDLRPRSTGLEETIPVGLVFRSVGYRGVSLPGVPFDEKTAVIPNHNGRVYDPETGSNVPGEYVGGWIKRGPSGVIGTNKPDASETVEAMFEDLVLGRTLIPLEPDPAAIEKLLCDRRHSVFTYSDWQAIDAMETKRGLGFGRPRIKLTSVEEMLAALGRSGGPS